MDGMVSFAFGCLSVIFRDFGRSVKSRASGGGFIPEVRDSNVQSFEVI